MASLRRLQSALAWVIPVLLIGGSISLPSYRHAHSTGDVAHRHGSQDGSTHGHHHHAGHSPSHSYDQDDLAGVRIAHLHVALLWFDFTLPASEDADPSDPGEAKQNSILVFVQPASGWPSIACDSSNPAQSRWANSHSIATNTVDFALAQADAPQLASSNLLCDSARLERSGVRRC